MVETIVPLAKRTYTAPINGTFALAIVKCGTTSLLNITYEIRYANNSLCVCGTISNPIAGFDLQCKNIISNMGIFESHYHLTESQIIVVT